MDVELGLREGDGKLRAGRRLVRKLQKLVARIALTELVAGARCVEVIDQRGFDVTRGIGKKLLRFLPAAFGHDQEPAYGLIARTALFPSRAPAYQLQLSLAELAGDEKDAPDQAVERHQ